MVALLAAALLSGCSRASPPAPSRQSPLKVTSGFVLVKAGSFVMGSAEAERGRYTNESEHEVVLTRDFEIATNEVTQAEFQALMGYNPSHFGVCPSCPVETVSWHEAAAYCNALSRRAGLAPCYACRGAGREVRCEPGPAHAQGRIYDCPGYRLPTDAEWEYAYRAGTTTAYYSGPNDPAQCNETTPTDANLSKIAWYVTSGTHPVAQKQANSWGLHDTAGNVWEWVHDWYGPYAGPGAVSDPVGPAAGNKRVARGGAFNNDAQHARAAHRGQFAPVIDGKLAQYIEIGFRAARTR